MRERGHEPQLGVQGRQERLEYDLLFRWFVGIGVDAACGTIRCSQRTATGCSKGISPQGSWRRFLDQLRVKKLLSTKHFTVDGTLTEAWASLKSFKPRDGSDEPRRPVAGAHTEADFYGKKRSNRRRTSRRRIPMHDSTARDYGQGGQALLYRLCA